ncbi:hypothetical protein ACWPMX_12995 [Tsuneonella sp. HG094]
MTLSRRALIATAPIAGLASSAPALGAAGPVGPAAEIRTFESFGAKGDAPDASGRGTDDTRAIQAAIDWASTGGGQRLPRALIMADRAYLCGQITLYPATTIIGTGRQTSAFICRDGTRGAWFSTRGNGAQKVMLSGFALYGRGQRGLESVLALGDQANEVPLGTESIIEGLWLRDAPEAIGLAVAGNVALINDLTVQSVRIGMRGRGAANHIQNLFVMQAGEGARSPATAIGADLSGWFVRGLHVEATVEAGIPLRLRGNSHALHAFIATVEGYAPSHLIDIDDSEYDEWSLDGVVLSENRYQVRNGIVRRRQGFVGGKNAKAFSGRSMRAQADAKAGPRASGSVAFSVTLEGSANGLTHAISALGRPGSAPPDTAAIRGANPVQRRGGATGGAFVAGGRVVGSARDQFEIDVPAPDRDTAAGTAGLELNSSGLPLNVRLDFTRGTVAVAFSHALTGEPFDLGSLAPGRRISVAVDLGR